jgi:hypothetical protein
MENNINTLRMACQRFIHAVINDFLAQMVWTGGVGVHPGATANRLKPGEYLNGIGVITGLRHGLFVQIAKQESDIRP